MISWNNGFVSLLLCLFRDSVASLVVGKEYSVHLVGLELNIYVTKMYGTTNIKIKIL
jgi:hypothetical protein